MDTKELGRLLDELEARVRQAQIALAAGSAEAAAAAALIEEVRRRISVHDENGG